MTSEAAMREEVRARYAEEAVSLSADCGVLRLREHWLLRRLFRLRVPRRLNTAGPPTSCTGDRACAQATGAMTASVARADR
jgi:hypothetical protein